MSDKTEVIKIMNRFELANKQEKRAVMHDLEQEMFKHEQLDLEPEQLIHGGMYARALTLPAGTLATGNIYKFDHIEVMTSGKIAVTTDDNQSYLLEGFNLLPAKSGKKRAVYAVEETTWITFHAVSDTGSMTGDQVQDSLTVATFNELEKFYNEVNKIDYESFLQQVGMTEEQMQVIVQNKDDMCEINLSECNLELRDSEIHGQGIFATKQINQGDVIGLARINDKRTQLGRYINHAVRPNVQFKLHGNHVNCFCIDDVGAGQELTVNYKQTIQMRKEAGDL